MLEVSSKDNLLCLIENFSNEVKKNYELNRYNEVYRNDKLITDFEQYCIDYFLELLGSAPHILDLGCGAAKTYDKYIVKCGCNLTGVDFSEKQISLARKNCPKGKFLCMDMLQYNFSDKFDGVVMFYSLFHIYRDYHSLILKRIYNSLYAKGKVLLNIRKKDSGNIKEKKIFAVSQCTGAILAVAIFLTWQEKLDLRSVFWEMKRNMEVKKVICGLYYQNINNYYMSKGTENKWNLR